MVSKFSEEPCFVKDIQSGVFHTIILTNHGDCYSGGDVESQKLGYESRDFNGFRRVNTIKDPVKLIRYIFFLN